MKKTIKIIGVHSMSEGYPNVRYRIEALRANKNIECHEYRASIWSTRFEGQNSSMSLLGTLVKAFLGHARVFWHLLFNNDQKILYVPYPGIFVVFLSQFLPKAKQPETIFLDAFISIYDTIVFDRKLIKETNILARSLKKIEGRCFEIAKYVLTDTQQNALYYAHLFRIPIEKFVALPLSTNELDYQVQQPLSRDWSMLARRKNRAIQVLFIGTLVPLHGVEVILQAARSLKNTGIRIRIIGDGQQRSIIESALEYIDNVVWLDRWLSPKTLNEEIHSSDICLGIFGESAKAQRVCPYKIYSYACCGAAIITSATDCINDLNARTSEPWLITVPASNPVALASEIRRLANSPEERAIYGQRSAQFYRTALSNQVAGKQLYDLIELSAIPSQ